MAKDPAFLFYPGDYLRDTQCLSEKVQVAYDRIMCEHMRNICISQQQLNFFTKRLSESEKEELEMVLSQVDGGFQIEWVALSIENRKAYSQSRRDNREGKLKKHMNNISKSYDNHMENANEIGNEIDNAIKEGNAKNKDKVKEKEIEHPLQEKIKASYPNVYKMKKQLTFDECEKLSEFPIEIICEILDGMENKPDLQKKYSSVNLTIRSWIKLRKDFKNGATNGKTTGSVRIYNQPVAKGTHDPKKSRELIEEAYPGLSSAEIDRLLLTN